MRPLALIGVVLAHLGAFILFQGMNHESKDEVLRVGDLKASVVEQKHAVPAWAGGLAPRGRRGHIGAGMKRRT